VRDSDDVIVTRAIYEKKKRYKSLSVNSHIRILILNRWLPLNLFTQHVSFLRMLYNLLLTTCADIFQLIFQIAIILKRIYYF